MDEAQVKQIIRNELLFLYNQDGLKFSKPIKVSDNVHISFSGVKGSKIGTTTADKIAFYGATPVDKPETVSDPTGGAVSDAQARNAIYDIIDRLQELGLIK